MNGCGHPSAPVSARRPDGLWACHCGTVLDPTTAMAETWFPTSPGPVSNCRGCGCHVALVGADWRQGDPLPPANAGEYRERFLANRCLEGYGIDIEAHEPCPYCAAPDFLTTRLSTALADLNQEGVCGACGRSVRFEVTPTRDGVEVELVQTGGPPAPTWSVYPPRRVDR